MTGLEKIVAAILDGARADAAATAASAKAEAERILSESAAESRARREGILADAKARAEQLERASASASALEKRRSILEAKQEMLAETTALALNTLRTLPEGEYFDLLVKMSAACAEPGEGEMLLSERDRARLPGDFGARLSAALPAGAKLSVSADTREIDGGFILRYGNIEINCSFAASFDARREEFTDAARGILFP